MDDLFPGMSDEEYAEYRERWIAALQRLDQPAVIKDGIDWKFVFVCCLIVAIAALSLLTIWWKP